MNNIPIWNNNNNKILLLENNLDVLDVLIIGGGLTGINIAYQFLKTNKQVVLIDKSGIGSGATGKSSAKLSYIQSDTYNKISNNKKSIYLNSQIEAINIIKNIIKDNNIDCNFTKCEELIFTQDKKNIHKIEKIITLLKKHKIKYEIVKNVDILYGLKIFDSYVFNPIKYLLALKNIIKNKIHIYENVIAKNINYKNNLYYVMTNRGIIKSKNIVIACHYPFFIYPLFIPLKTYIKREYVNAFKVEKSFNFTQINIDKILSSIRYYNNYLIFVSNEQKLTNNYNYFKNYIKSYNDTLKFFNKKPEFTWMNQDIISNDNLPFIGKVKNNLYISTAYNKWGMTNSAIASKIIYDLIENNNNKYVKLFNPNRINLKIIFKSILNTYGYVKVYIQALFNKNNPKYIKIDKFYYGIYKDKENKYHKIKLICPHMKCMLVFNRMEETWDCPCHGSRFDLDGNIISGPAKENLKKYE